MLWVAGAVGSRCPAGDFRAMAVRAFVCATEIPILRIPTTLPTKRHQFPPQHCCLGSWIHSVDASLIGCLIDLLRVVPLGGRCGHAAGNISTTPPAIYLNWLACTQFWDLIVCFWVFLVPFVVLVNLDPECCIWTLPDAHAVNLFMSSIDLIFITFLGLLFCGSLV